MKVDILEVRQNRRGHPGGHCEGEGGLGSPEVVATNKQESSPPSISNRMALEHLILGVTLSSA